MIHLILAQQGGGGGGIISLILFYVAIFLIFYFILIWPQRREKKRKEQLISSLKKGDRIITIGGIIGEIKKVGDDFFVIESENSTFRIDKWYVADRREK